MKLAGAHPLSHPPAAVWEALMDPEVLSRTLPGCERLERVERAAGGAPALADAIAFRGAMTVQVGPVRGAFQGGLELSDVRPPTSYRMKLQGQGPSGFLTGEGEVRLEETAAGATLLHYDLDAQVGGRIAGVGQRLLESSAKVIAKQGLEGLERQLAARHPAVAAAAPGAGEDPASPPRDPLEPVESGPAAPHSKTPRDPATAAAGAPGKPLEAPGEAPPPPAAAPDRPQAPPPPSQAQFAGRFAKGLWEELVPQGKRGWVLAAAALVAALLLLLALRACAG